MAKFIIQDIGKGKVTIRKQVSRSMYGVSWRIGTSTTVDNNKRDVADGKAYIDDYINERLGWPLARLVETYPKQYEAALNKTSGKKAKITYKKAVELLGPYLRLRVSGNTYYNRIRALELYGREYELNERDATLITREEINRILIEKHTSLNTESLATFYNSRSAFKWLYKYLESIDYVEKGYITNHRFSAPEVLTDRDDIGYDRDYFYSDELDYIYDCLDDPRHLSLNEEYFKELRAKIRRGEITDDRQYYKAHYKVRRVLQLMIDTGLRQGEVLALRKANLHGMVRLDKAINKRGSLWRQLGLAYARLVSMEPFKSVVKEYKFDDLNWGNVYDISGQSEQLGKREHLHLYNQLRFVLGYTDEKTVTWRDFKWYRFMNWMSDDIPGFSKPTHFTNVLIDKGEFFWLADIFEEFEEFKAYLVIKSTVTKGVNNDGSVMIRAKGGTKTTAGTGRKVFLNGRARETISKTWRDILRLEQDNPDKIDYLFLNSSGQLYNPISITNAWTKLNRKMSKDRPDLPMLSPHKIRHSRITIRAQESKTMSDLLALKDEVGHSNLLTTLNVYVHSVKSDNDPSKSDV